MNSSVHKRTPYSNKTKGIIAGPPSAFLTERHCLCVYVCVHTCVCVCVHSVLTLCDPMNCSPPVSSVHGIFQARILEWVAIFFYMGSSQPRDRTGISCISYVGRQVFLPAEPLRHAREIL